MSSKISTEIAYPPKNSLGRFVKGFKHSEEWKNHISQIMKGRKITWRDKISKSLIGHPGQKGEQNYFYGKHLVPWNKEKNHTIEARKKMSIAHSGKTLSKEHKEKIGLRIKELGIKPPIIKGDRHHSWKGGITPFAESVRKCLKYREWRTKIFRRDKFTCQFCKKSGVYLEADHFPITFAKILEDNKIRTLEVAFSCKILWNIDNGRTLCSQCHDKSRKR